MVAEQSPVLRYAQVMLRFHASVNLILVTLNRVHPERTSSTVFEYELATLERYESFSFPFDSGLVYGRAPYEMDPEINTLYIASMQEAKL